MTTTLPPHLQRLVDETKHLTAKIPREATPHDDTRLRRPNKLAPGEYVIVSGQKMSHKAAAMFRIRAVENMARSFKHRIVRVEKELAQLRAQVEAMP